MDAWLIVFQDIVEFGVGERQFDAALLIRRNLVGIVDEGDGLLTQDEVLGGEHVHGVEVTLILQFLEAANTDIRTEGFLKAAAQPLLIARHKDVGECELTTCEVFEVHRQMLVDAMGTALIIIEVDMINGCIVTTLFR